MTSTEWVTVCVSALAVVGTLAATVLGQRGEAQRAATSAQQEETRRAQDRTDARGRELREAVRVDYREVLLFVTRTRLFAIELRRRFAEIDEWTRSGATDDKEVADLEARAAMLHRRLLDELPDAQTLVGVWAPDELLHVFDDIYAMGPTIEGGVRAALHAKYQGDRLPAAMSETLSRIDELIGKLDEARRLLQRDQLPGPN